MERLTEMVADLQRHGMTLEEALEVVARFLVLTGMVGDDGELEDGVA